MNSREKAARIFDLKSSGEGVVWTGHPNEATIPIYAKEWSIPETREAIFEYLQDDCRWIPADSGYIDPHGRPMFDSEYGISKRNTLSGEGCFAGHEEDLSILDKHPWPKVENLDFTGVYNEMRLHQDKMVFSGMWSAFFHVLCDYLGMENYFIQMYENPKFVEALTERVVDFYVEANEKFFAGAGDLCDTMFFGNDFGTQLDLLIPPDKFRQFILPSYKRLVNVGKKYNKKIMQHSCGSIHKVIPDMINVGIEILHPLQAQACGMSAQELTQYKNDLAFVGGIDAQTFFVNAKPDEIKREVERVAKLLGPNIVISPSHEEILPNIPAANIKAMVDAARGL